MAEIIDGRALARRIRQEVKEEVAGLGREGVVLGLAAVLVGDDPASRIYVETKRRASREVGITSRVERLPADASQRELQARIDGLNEDPSVHGILVQRPLPPHLSEQAALGAVAPAKDVDGFHPVSMGRLLAGSPTFVPATPLGIQTLLLRSGHPPEGKDVVIVGRSGLVGKPLAALLMQKAEGGNATVTVCHSHTARLEDHARRAEILVVAAGRPGLVGAEMVQAGAVVVDVGINRVPDPEAPRGYRIVGDVDFDAVSRVAGAITPVPGGVGPMTVAMLLKNTVAAGQGPP